MHLHPSKLYSSSASESGAWFVWDIYKWPPAPVFVGTMEEAGEVADVLNRNLVEQPD